ncbi:unnamed protein product, partial [Didymodactylos carnosus]
MAFLSIQRCVHVRQSIIVKKNIWSYIFIFTSFLLAYLFEFFGLTLFCSKENNRQLSRSWFEYTIKYLPNYTHLLTSKMLNDTLSYECVQQYIESNLTIMSNHSCTSDHFSTILGRYFDLHNSAIVRLIQLIHQHQTGQNLTRHEIRLAYQYHKCFIKFDSSVFLKNYKFLYDRKISLNRYTLLLVFGSMLPSLITIVANIVCVLRILNVKIRSSLCLLPSRRRIDETRRILTIITIECIVAIINCWFIDVLLSFIYCKRNLFIGFDCP